MNLQKDFLFGFLVPLLALVALVIPICFRKNLEKRIWVVPFFIALIYPFALWFRLGNHVWPIADSLDRLIAIVPVMCLVNSGLMLLRSKYDFHLLMVALIGGLIALGIRKTNSLDSWQVALWISSAALATCGIAIGVARFVKRDDSLLMPVLMAGTSLSLAGYVSFTGSVTLGQSVLPFAGTVVALLTISLVFRKSVLTPTLSIGLITIFTIFLMGSFWWTSSFELVEFPESILLLSLPLFGWLKYAPILRNWNPIRQLASITLIAAVLAGVVIKQKQSSTMNSLEVTTPYYHLDR